MPYLVINVLLQVIGIYLVTSSPQRVGDGSWGIDPRILLGMLIFAISLVTGLVFSVLVFMSKRHSKVVSALLSFGMFVIPLGLMGWAAIRQQP